MQLCGLEINTTLQPMVGMCFLFESSFLNALSSLTDDLADDLEDVDFEETGNAEDDDEGWETEDEMEAETEQDDSELTFSKHTGNPALRSRAPAVRQPHSCTGLNRSSCIPVQARCSAWTWTQQQTAWQWREERMIKPTSGGWAMARFCWSAPVSVDHFI